MTENEAVKKLNMLDEALNFQRYDADECSCALQMAIQALEEIQQYRAIGTAEGYERAIESSIENYNLYREYKAKVQAYESIGTVEEFKNLKLSKKGFITIGQTVEEFEKEIRAKAIDEFAERLNKRLHCAFSDDLEIQKYVNEIAEQMKGSGENV